MVAAIVDTNIVVDLLRFHSPAISWYQSQNQPGLGITPIIWMEAIEGGENKVERLRAARLLQRFTMVYFTQADMDWAMQQQMAYELSHGVGIRFLLIGHQML